MIDAHVHLWDRARFDYAWLANAGPELQRDIGAGDLANELGDAVEGAVFVQADCDPSQSLAEAGWVQGLADAGGPIVAIVAAAPLELGGAVAGHLDSLAELRSVAGVRRLTQDEAPGFMLEPRFVEGIRLLAAYGMTMDLCIRSWQLPEATALVAACPEVTFVLDHLGKPAIDDGAFGDWAAQLNALANAPNVRCKLSGLATEASGPLHSPDAVRPWLDHALSAFGAERCMFGSDWPVLTLAARYGWWVDAVAGVVDDLTEAEAARVWAGTAAETYDPLRRQQQQKESAAWH
jgi:L-fuconolactonase